MGLTDGAQQLIKRRIQRNFNAALPTHGGDSAFPLSRKWREAAHTVGTITATALRAAGFEIMPDPTTRFPNHARLIHPRGAAGFTDENLETLAATFRNTPGL